MIEKHYKDNASYQRPSMPVEERIVEDMSDPDHFHQYLGKEKYYIDFLVFWQSEMEKKGWENVLNEYLFAGGERADDLLTRMYAGMIPWQTPLGLLLLRSRLPPSAHPPRLWNRVQPTCHHCRSSRPSLLPRFLDISVPPQNRSCFHNVQQQNPSATHRRNPL